MSRVDPPGRKRSALVVDDDPAVQGSFVTLLGRNGFAVDIALTGSDAFEYMRRASYSVILLDLMMPNGFELIERLERDSPWLLSRIIIVTGTAQGGADSLDESRVWGVIRKPFDIDHLLECARSCAEGQRLVATGT